MAKKIMLMVTQPIHGADGHSVEHNPGDLLPLDAELPAGLEHFVTETIADVPDKPAPRTEPKPEPRHETRPAPAAKPRA